MELCRFKPMAGRCCIFRAKTFRNKDPFCFCNVFFRRGLRNSANAVLRNRRQALSNGPTASSVRYHHQRQSASAVASTIVVDQPIEKEGNEKYDVSVASPIFVPGGQWPVPGRCSVLCERSIPLLTGTAVIEGSQAGDLSLVTRFDAPHSDGCRSPCDGRTALHVPQVLRAPQTQNTRLRTGMPRMLRRGRRRLGALPTGGGGVL